MAERPEASSLRHEAEAAAQHFPALLLEAERIAQSVASGLHGRRRAGPGETFWQHRPYAFGDPVSMIDWRQSARAADRLYVRQNEWEAPAAAFFWRDASRSLDYTSGRETPTKRRRADVILLALTILLSEAGERIGLLGDARRPFQGRTAPERMLEALSAGAFADENTPPALGAPTGARVVLASDFFTAPEDVARSVAALAAGGVRGALLQVCDPAEEAFPFEGRVEFRDLESRDRLIFGDAGRIAAAYREQFIAHRDALRGLAARHGWTFIAHRTDRPAQTVLLALFAALADMALTKA